MPYALRADITVFVHMLFIGYVVLGQLLILAGWPLGWRWIRSRWFRLSHLACIGIVVGQILAGIQCPLTVWEYDWRILAGQDWYTREGWSAVGAFCHDLVIFDTLPFDHWAFQVGYVTFTLAVLATLLTGPAAIPTGSGGDGIMHETLADAILVMHSCYAGFLVVGMLLIVVGWLAGWQWIRNPWFRGAHLLAIVFVVIRTVFLETCPFSTWEWDLRHQAGLTWEATSAPMRFLQSALGYDVTASASVFMWIYVAFGVLVVVTLLLAPPRAFGRQPGVVSPAITKALP